MRPSFFDLSLFSSAFSDLTSSLELSGAELIRSEIEKSRQRVQALLDGIPADCRGLTIHDVTHLDALWDIAELLCADRFKLNPAELYVLSNAILLHDAGLTAAAYPGGVSELQKTATWRDSEAILLSSLASEGRTMNEQDVQAQVLFATLRELHAATAEALSTTKWRNPSDGSDLFIIESEELRTSYAQSIGRVASSHHWDVASLFSLRDKVGAPPSFPPKWTVDERLLACILRLADVAQIDRRRAPSMHYAVRRPVGRSELHWRFQNKLAQPALRGNALLLTGAGFTLAEADAWWLAYEAISAIDRELNQVNGALVEIGYNEVAASSVVGANNPPVLAKYIPTIDWRPVDASIRVSDPAHLAATLGGTNLYGVGLLPPIRELLQNSADAVRARRSLEGRDSAWGQITVKFSRRDEDFIDITISDNGVGMSPAVMTGPLVDFGKSFWQSEMMLREYPGLAERRPQTIGKYGIGFFSVFGVSKRISVISRKYDAAGDSVHELNFGDVSSRPILKKLKKADIEVDVSTVVRLTVDDVLYRRSLSSNILKLVLGLDVVVNVIDEIDDASYSHNYDIYTSTPASFLEAVLGGANVGMSRDARELTKKLLAPIQGEGGRRYGRAAIDFEKIADLVPYRENLLIASADGFSGLTNSTEFPVPMIGLVSGTNTDISRNTAAQSIPKQVYKKWLTKQCNILLKSALVPPNMQAAVARAVLDREYDPGGLPIVMAGGKAISATEFVAKFAGEDEVWLPISANYEKALSLMLPGEIYYVEKYMELDGRVVFPINAEKYGGKVFSAYEGERLLSGEGDMPTEGALDNDEVKVIANLLRKAWGAELTVNVSRRPFATKKYLFGEKDNLCLVIQRAGGSLG